MRWIHATLLVALLSLAFASSAAACTGITLTAADGSVVRGRTLEFAEPLNSDVIFVPRGISFTGTTPDGKEDGLKWVAKYAAAGANGMNLSVIVDGLNEKGLSGGIFYFPGFADYQGVAADEMNRALAPWELLTWALTSFATVDEVQAALPDIRVDHATLAAWNLVPSMHYLLTDASGKSIAVEYVDGELHIYDNPLGVFTNSPSFDWHLTNLRNYINITADPEHPIAIDTVNLDPLSTGGNLFGLPGDFSSPSRFVRATVFSHFALPQPTGEAAIMQGFHLLDQFDIPPGSVPEPKGSEPPFEITEWTTMSDLKALKFYIWTEDNRAIRTFDLAQADLDGDVVQTFPLDQEQTFVALETH